MAYQNLFEVQVLTKGGAAALFTFTDEERAKEVVLNWRKQEMAFFSVQDDFGKRGSWLVDQIAGIIDGNANDKFAAELNFTVLAERGKQKIINAVNSDEQVIALHNIGRSIIPGGRA